MRLVLLNIIIFFLIIGETSGAVLNGELVSGTTQLREGDIFEGIMRIWPFENTDRTVFKQLEKNILFNAFYVAELDSIDVSENNADVLEIKATFIVKSKQFQPTHHLVLGSDTVDLVWKGPTITELKSKSKNYYIENQTWNAQRKWWLIIALAASLLVIIYYFRKQLFKYWNKKEKEVYSSKFFDELFRAAGTREEFERIYALKNHWMPLLKTKAPAHYDFIKTINQHQYKKRWGTEELTDVKSSFDIIRRSFSL